MDVTAGACREEGARLHPELGEKQEGILPWVLCPDPSGRGCWGGGSGVNGDVLPKLG